MADSTSIEQPFPIFFDKVGKPLDSGYVYIGEYGKNPQTNPIQTFWDEALTQPAVQPIRTINGYYSRYGTPSRVFIQGVSCSITVRDKYQTVVYSELKTSGRVAGLLNASAVLDDSGQNQQQINDKSIAAVKSISDLIAIQNPKDGQVANSKGYHKAVNFALAQPYAGGSTYVYNSAKLKTTHNGGTIIAAGKSFPSDWSIRENVEEWFNGSSLTGTGCWVLLYEGAINVTKFGAIPNFSLGIDNSIAINKALSVRKNIFIPSGDYIIHRPILTHAADTVITGSGRENTIITVEDTNWQPVTYNLKSYNGVIADTSGVDMSWIVGATFSDFTIRGNSTTADGKSGIIFDNVCTGVNVSNILITTCDKGIYTYKSWVHSYNNVTVTDCFTNSFHGEFYVNGYSFTGCLFYGKEIVTSKHILIEKESYGNSWTGGAIEKAHVGVSLKDNAQLNISGCDWEVIDLAFIESVNNAGLPSTIEACSIMGSPTQSGFALSDGNLIVEGNKIFNPLGDLNIASPIYFVEGSGGLVINNNSYGNHTTFSGGTGKIIGNDLGRYDFTKSKRITNNRVLDAYEEKYQDYFEFFTNTGAAYPRVSQSFVDTQIGNLHNIHINTMLNRVTSISGDYLTFKLAGLSGDCQVGSFVFSKTAEILSNNVVSGSIYSSNGTCYLIKSSGGLLTKQDLSSTGDTNLFRLQISYIDFI